MKIDEIRKLSKEEICKKIVEQKETLFTKRMQASQGSLEKPVELRQLRKDIARLKTVLKEKEMGGEK